MILLSPFLQVKVSVVNSAGGSFCWNYATDTSLTKKQTAFKQRKTEILSFLVILTEI